MGAIARGREIELPVGDGTLAGLDFGGDGVGVLLVHGTGHNATAWAEVASHLAGHAHAVAVDLRGHGRTELDSTDAEQYWRDLGRVTTALRWDRPVLVGHSTGGYAVTAAVAAGLVTPASLCVVDGMVLDSREDALAAHAALGSPSSQDWMRETFRYGWVTTEDEMHDWVEQCARESDSDPLNAGARPELVEQVLRRSFVRRGREWQRRPTLPEIAATTAASPDARVFPSVEVYDEVACPLTVVLPDQGFYAARRDEVRAVVDRAPERALIELAANHNVPMTAPAALASVLVDLLRR